MELSPDSKPMRDASVKWLAFFPMLFFLSSLNIYSQSVSYGPKTSPNVDFTFNTLNKYLTGITFNNVLALNINADLTQWDLYVGASTSAAGLWDVTTYYSTTGDDPDVGMVEIRLTNLNNTSQVSGFFQLTDIATPTDIIGDHLNAPDPPVDCDDADPTGTNIAGDYSTEPACYKFNVDLKITPGLTYRAGLYTLRIDFILAQDL